MLRTLVRNADLLIRCRETFHAGAMSAHYVEPGDGCECGRLPVEWHDAFRAACSGGAYVVFSYATPIGWADSGGAVTVPDTRHSVTTSRHQSLTRAGLGVPANTPAPAPVAAALAA